jgi:hypothetical protein
VPSPAAGLKWREMKSFLTDSEPLEGAKPSCPEKTDHPCIIFDLDAESLARWLKKQSLCTRFHEGFVPVYFFGNGILLLAIVFLVEDRRQPGKPVSAVGLSILISPPYRA